MKISERITGPQLMAAQAKNFVERGASVIIANSQAAYAAREATRSIPIVFQSGPDPVAAGLVGSLSRPGGNMTGVSLLGPALVGKRAEILRELVAD